MSSVGTTSVGRLSIRVTARRSEAVSVEHKKKIRTLTRRSLMGVDGIVPGDTVFFKKRIALWREPNYITSNATVVQGPGGMFVLSTLKVKRSMYSMSEGWLFVFDHRTSGWTLVCDDICLLDVR